MDLASNTQGKFDLTVNGTLYEILPNNIIFLENIKEAEKLTYDGSSVSCEISNSIVFRIQEMNVRKMLYY